MKHSLLTGAVAVLVIAVHSHGPMRYVLLFAAGALHALGAAREYRDTVRARLHGGRP